MDMSATEWLNLILRWTHVIAAIFWIGHAFLFNELDEALVPPEEGDDREGLQGEMYMVHGGGFYKVEKGFGFPKNLRGELKWFRWEAAFTWLSGFFLLVVVFYMGGGVYMLDPNSGVALSGAIGVSIGSLVAGWIVYDLLCRSPLVNNTAAFAVVMWGLITAAGLVLTQFLSGRAAFLHVGAMIATIMAANVWMLIIPTMRKMVAAVEKSGGIIDQELGKKAKQRSKHNNYFIFPVIFLMISNHYPTLYGHEYNWVILGVMVALGGGVKHVMNLRGDIQGVYLAVALSVVGGVGLWAASMVGSEVEVAPIDTSGLEAIDPATAGTVRGTVLFEGEVPAPREVTLINCPQQEGGPALLQPVRVADGKLQDVFVWVKSGLEGYDPGPVPDSEVVIDQRGCLYVPTVAGVRTGQTVAFLNSDPVPHNVRAVSDANPTFNEMMVGQDTRFDKVFKKPDIMLQSKCDIHPWMSAYLGVVAHGAFGVTGSNGGFALEGLPPGEYVVGAWHEIYGQAEQTVTVPGADLTFTFGP